ncbi:sensor histidine kinase [Bacillus ginsengihumi]|uniref:histidine kinase n=1 Tax=Heyndrickxia ginsengihumi TaxID=363870 RepID=A0A6M0P704_9BACI|nr:sensor histidine kinase [Heyndrickxia ginsengihumi]NEY20273.1 sensor histidine kinase [Heyndrickxia ginsengihumi]
MHYFNKIFPRFTGLTPYVWIIFCILPFYYILKSSSIFNIVAGIFMIMLFITCYRLSFIFKGWLVYVLVSFQIVLCVAMTYLFGYIYFSIFLALFIGNVQNRAGFITLYTVHLVATITAVSLGFFFQNKIFITQLPFILICVIGVILLPLNTYNRHKQEKLEQQLKDANERIAELVKFEERNRIARDLHDVLGQKLSLIVLKSELAGKLVDSKPKLVSQEIKDIRKTARTALTEMRELVSNMRGKKLGDEIIRIKQILKAAQIDFTYTKEVGTEQIPHIVENVLSMCLKESINNIVKHSKATSCKLYIEDSQTEWLMKIVDNGIGIEKESFQQGNGLKGMRERLDFVNGMLDIQSDRGMSLLIKVPKVIKK